MKALLVLSFSLLMASANVFAQTPQTIKLERWASPDIPDGPGCSFYMAPPDGAGTEADTILWVQTSVDGDISIRVNGKNLRLKWSPGKNVHNSGADFSGAWSEGKVTVEVYCNLLNGPENTRFYKGILELRIGKQIYKYKINGFCGC
jgi:hypothetical protein